MNKEFKNYVMITAGSFLSCLGINLFVVPAHLYNGGTIGISQIIRTMLEVGSGLTYQFDIAGILNFLINIPLLILAYRSIGKEFLQKTLFSLVTQTFFFTVIPVNLTILSDRLMGCIIAGVLMGYGVGITLLAGGSGGGLDIVGVYLLKRSRNASVGKVNLYINACIYMACAFLFELPTALYSVVYSMIYGFVIDRTHMQNINTGMMVFSSNRNLHSIIIKDLGRGVTCWEGMGGYSGKPVCVYYTVLSKYERKFFEERIMKADASAFIISLDGYKISGNYKKILHG